MASLQKTVLNKKGSYSMTMRDPKPTKFKPPKGMKPHKMMRGTARGR